MNSEYNIIISGLGCRKVCIGTEWATSPLLCMNVLRKIVLSLRKASILAMKVFLSLDRQSLDENCDY